jgi:hypothetical protein
MRKMGMVRKGCCALGDGVAVGTSMRCLERVWKV